MFSLLTPLNTNQIDKLCLSLKKKGLYLGCFAADKIPLSYCNPPYGFVANTDASHLPGTHWVAVWVPRRDEAWYFDSLAENHIGKDMETFLKSFKKVRMSNVSVQNPFSTTCGHFAVVFIALCAKKVNFSKIIETFTRLANRSDMFVALVVRTLSI